MSASVSADFATTVTYRGVPSWDTRARDIVLTQDRKHSLIDDLVQMIAVLRAALSEATLVLDSQVGRLQPDLVACVLIGIFWPRRKKPAIVMFGDMWQRRRGIKGRLQRSLIRLADRAVTLYAALSQAEVAIFPETWGVGDGKIRFVPYMATLSGTEASALTRLASCGAPRARPLVFAGGDSLRDYDPLIKVAARMPGCDFVLATSLLDGHKSLPANLTAGFVSHERYNEMFAAADIVVVALRRDLTRSTGHQTYLNSLLLAKPTIVADSPGVRDYLGDGTDALIVALIVDGSLESYERAITFALDPQNAAAVSAMAEAGRVLVANHYAFEDHVAALLEVVDEAQRVSL